ncbi:MAG: insulinase family protein [Candidatus Thiodiazotropha sp.]
MAKNAVVAIVGAVDQDQAKDIAEAVVGGLPSGEAMPPLPDVPSLDQGVVKQISFPSTQSHLYLGQPGLKRGDPDYFPLYVGNHILGGSGLVSLLSEEVREKRGLSYSVYSYFIPMRQLGLFQVGLQTKNEQADEALRVVKDTLQRYITEGPTDEELQAAKQNITGGFPLQIASNGKVVSYLAMIGFYDLPLDYLDVFVDKINSVSKQQIRDAFRRRVDSEHLVRVQVGRFSAPVAQVKRTEAAK